jgi:uncharacterized peroxidase-related enzyme
MESHEKDLRAEVGGEREALAVQSDYRSAGLTRREIVLLDYAIKLTREPGAATCEDLDNLRQQGLTEEQLVDAVHAIGYFNFINRVLDGLGVDPEESMRYGKVKGGGR